MNENLSKYQYQTILDTANNLIFNLMEQEGIFIINKNMEVRVMFYYKPYTYFISESFSIKNIAGSSIDINNSSIITKISQYISNRFEGTDYLTESKLIKNIDKFIEEYMVDTLCLVVDRVNHMIINSISFEYYNELYLKNDKGLFKLLDINNSIYKLKIPLNKFNNIITTISYYQQLFDYIKNMINIYPNNSNNDYLEIINDTDINDSSVFVLVNMSCNTLISYEKIIINTELGNDIIFNIILDILNIDRDTTTLIDDLKLITEYTDPKFLN